MVIAKCPVVEDTLSSNDQRLLSFFWEMRDTEIPLVVFSLPSFLYGRKILASSPSAGYRQSLNWAQTPSIQPGVSISPMPSPSGKTEQALVSGTFGQTPSKTFPQFPGGAGRSVLLECETERNWCFHLSLASPTGFSFALGAKQAEFPSWKHWGVISTWPKGTPSWG